MVWVVRGSPLQVSTTCSTRSVAGYCVLLKRLTRRASSAVILGLDEQLTIQSRRNAAQANVLIHVRFDASHERRRAEMPGIQIADLDGAPPAVAAAE